MWVYRIAYAVDALATLILVYFFVDGLRYTTDFSYVTVWLPLLIVPMAILVAAPILRRRGRTGAATVLLSILAVPPIGFALFFGLLIALHPRWN